MRRSLCLAVACMLALVVVSVSNVSAIGLNKIQYTEWLVSTTWTWYTPEGYYNGAAAGGDAIMGIASYEEGADIEWESLVSSSYVGSAIKGDISLNGYTYDATTNVLKSTYGSVQWDDFSYEGELSCKITFSSANAFTGKVRIIFDEFGNSLVISLQGKKLGQYNTDLR